MAKNFRELEAKMSPRARARSDAKTQKKIEELPDDSAHDPGIATRADARRLRHRESDERLEWA
jgi:hypothetical protein